MQKKTALNPPGIAGQKIVHQRSWRATEAPATNGHGNARALAPLYGALATTGDLDGRHILIPQWIEHARTEAVYGHDALLGRVTRFSLGFQLTRPLGPKPRAFSGLLTHIHV